VIVVTSEYGFRKPVLEGVLKLVIFALC